MPRLIVEQGKNSGAEILVIGAVTVGRDHTCGLPIHDRQASRQHCRFEAFGDRLKVKDLDSRNGILVNGAKTLEAELQVGDRVTVGGTVLKVAEGAVGPWSGKTVAGYRFLDKIGEGGMGEVYRAEQLSMRRFVAAKVLAARLREDPRYIERLVAEARAAAQLNHPGLIQVHDVIQVPEITFFSMELVQGKTLRDHLRRSPLGLSHTLSVAKGVLEALQYAHGKNLVHHDVKPENVMLSEEGGVKLADLGIAQPAGAKTQESASGKRTLLGTPQYMPPDQVRADRADPRFDLYALGATLYHALAGRSPYRGSSPEEIVKQVLAGPPPPLSSQASGAPPDLIGFVEHLMARDPQKRIQTAQQGLKALASLQARYGEGEAGTASSTTGSGTGAKTSGTDGISVASPWPKRLALSTAALLLLAATAFAARHFAVQTDPDLPHILPLPPPPPIKRPPVKPPQPPPLTALLDRAKDARRMGNLQEARDAALEYQEKAPYDGDGLKGHAEAKDILDWVEQERSRLADDSAWEELKAGISSLSLDERLTRLGQFLKNSPANRHCEEARILKVEAEKERDSALEIAACLRADRELAAARALVDPPAAPPRFQAALDRIRTFRDERPRLTSAKAGELASLEREITRRRDDYWAQILKETARLKEARQFGEAHRRLKDLISIPGEVWGDASRIPLRDLDVAESAFLKQVETEVSAQTREFKLETACVRLDEAAQALKDTPQEARVQALLDRTRDLKDLHGQTIAAISSCLREKQFPITIKQGPGRVDEATADKLQIRLTDGTRIGIHWTDLSLPESFALYRNYLDRRETRSHYLLFCLYWDRKQWKEAEAEFELAKSLLEKAPGMVETYTADSPLR